MGIAYKDAKAIAAQMARFEFVRVSRDLQDADAVAFEVGESIAANIRHRNPLPGDGVAILEPGGADFVVGDAEASGNLALEVLRPHRALFDPEIDVIAAAAGLVSGDFFDLEIFRLLLDRAANAGEFFGNQGKRREWIERHRWSSLRGERDPMNKNCYAD